MSANAINAVCPLCGKENEVFRERDGGLVAIDLDYHIWIEHVPSHTCWCGFLADTYFDFKDHLAKEGIEAHCMDKLMGVRECKPGN